MNRLDGRVTRLEKQLEAMTWQEHVRILVKQGKLTAFDVLQEMGTLALKTWPEWYWEYDQTEVARIAQESDQRTDVVFARYSDAEIQAMLDGRMPFPEDL